ncbi:MAG: TlpA family protein disulfide reductase [Candidatus Competibacteraceae bacterium]|nr:TlpA family protein disulfide reductase [Candidatus Competibacteraceae bacterium]
MKTIINFIAVFFGLTFVLLGQTYKIPQATVQNIQGGQVSTSTFSNDGKPIIISFWATWCKPCIAELSSIAENYEDWQDETGVKLIAISIDDARNVAKVAPFVNGKSWEYEVYCDPNGDFKRAMSVNTVPHTFLVDGNGDIVWQHNSYNPGDEDELFKLVQKLAKGEKIVH